MELLKLHVETLNKFGFIIEVLGPESYFLKAVPAYLKNLQADYRQLIYNILDDLTTFNAEGLEEKITSSIAASIACHSAIKANEEAPLAVLESVVHALFSCKNPYVCPHGRPAIIRMSIDELAKKFKRK